MEIEKMTNTEITELIKELEGKYKKLLKVANKLANEMDSLSEKYKAAKAELIKRKGGND